MGRGKERLKRQRRKIRSIRNNKIQKIYLDEKLDLHKFAPGKYIANFLKTGEQLRANVCKNRAKSKFPGHSQKIVFAYILSID